MNQGDSSDSERPSKGRIHEWLSKHKHKREESPVNMAHVKILSQKFDDLDKDHSGNLTKDEIRACLELFGLSTNEAKSFIQNFDTDKNGKISKAEFMNAVHKMKTTQVTEAQLRALFRKADINNSGKIDTKEMKRYLEENRNVVSKKQVQLWIKEHDKDEDGELDYEEFLQFLKEHL